MSAEGLFFKPTANLPGVPRRVEDWLSEPPEDQPSWDAAIQRRQEEEAAIAPHLPVDTILHNLLSDDGEAEPATQLNRSRGYPRYSRRSI